MPGQLHSPRSKGRASSCGGDRALAGRGGDADEVLRGVLDVGDIPERAGTGDQGVGAQRQGQDSVRLDRPAGDDRDRAPQDAEIQEPVGQLCLAGRSALEPGAQRRFRFDPRPAR